MGPRCRGPPKVPRCSHSHPPAPRETYGDDVPLQAVGRVGALDHGTELGVAHPRLGAGGAHGTWRPGEAGPKERWLRMSRTCYKRRLRHRHTALPRFTGAELSFRGEGAGGESHSIWPRGFWSSSPSTADVRDALSLSLAVTSAPTFACLHSFPFCLPRFSAQPRCTSRHPSGSSHSLFTRRFCQISNSSGPLGLAYETEMETLTHGLEVGH